MIPIPSCRLLLAPASGRVRPTTAPDARVTSGDVIGILETGGHDLELTTPSPGTFGGFLVGARQSVRAGTPVAWVAS